MLRESYDDFLAGKSQRDSSEVFSPHRKRVKESVLWVLKKLS
jgi:hypothetical protein